MRDFCKKQKVSKKETFTVIIFMVITVQSWRRGEACCSRRSYNGTDFVAVLLCLLFGAIFIVLLVIKIAAGERHRVHRWEQEEIIGWRLGARGDAPERSGGERRDKTLGGGWSKRPASGGENDDNGRNVEENRGETRGEWEENRRVL